MEKRYGVIYARYSAGPHQTDQSIEGQVRDCMAYAKSHNITIIETYADRHISGKSMEHREEQNKEGFQYNGHAWTHNNIHRLLLSEIYIGVYHYGENVNEHTFPPIVDKELWDMAQKKIKAESHPSVHAQHAGRSYAGVDFLLTGKISCGICGLPVLRRIRNREARRQALLLQVQRPEEENAVQCAHVPEGIPGRSDSGLYREGCPE